FMVEPQTTTIYQALVKGTADGGSGEPVTIVVGDISDAGEVGKSVLLAEDQAAARAAIGAGTSNLALGTTASRAAAGDHDHAVTADAGSGLAAAATIQALAVALSARIKVLEDATP